MMEFSLTDLQIKRVSLDDAADVLASAPAEQEVDEHTTLYMQGEKVMVELKDIGAYLSFSLTKETIN